MLCAFACTWQITRTAAVKINQSYGVDSDRKRMDVCRFPLYTIEGSLEVGDVIDEDGMGPHGGGVVGVE